MRAAGQTYLWGDGGGWRGSRAGGHVTGASVKTKHIVHQSHGDHGGGKNDYKSNNNQNDNQI